MTPERVYTFAEVRRDFLKVFPSDDALRKFLDRRRGLVQIRHQRCGRSTVRVLSESEIAHLQEILSS